MKAATVSQEKNCYVGRMPCGCVVAAMAITPENRLRTAKQVGEWIKDGLTVELQTSDFVRQNLKRCPHSK